ncbi:MAG: tRNA (guanosine(37)-N1)-methyltransferase TrmD [Syntrophomonadaceae bacterium]|mgnify:CR=1 FL=1
MRIDILTLFPGMFASPFAESMVKRAIDKGALEINITDIRSFAEGKHLQADDYPYGGGAGMVLKADVVLKALASRRSPACYAIYLSPRGKRLTQAKVRELSQMEHIILLCGHYEGIDERVMTEIDEELSIGDYILTGGELPAMVVVDAVARLLPGVLGDELSSQEESFSAGLLEYPHYTRPAVYNGLEVPAVLLSGHHEKIRRWRLQESLRQTLLKRPDLLLERDFTEEERQLLEAILFERKQVD